jgi:hypothetical protein
LVNSLFSKLERDGTVYFLDIWTLALIKLNTSVAAPIRDFTTLEGIVYILDLTEKINVLDFRELLDPKFYEYEEYATNIETLYPKIKSKKDLKVHTIDCPHRLFQ